MANHRIGLIVPSSNTTMETEVPAMLRLAETDDDTFTFHSSRVRLDRVTQEELTKMVADSDRCAIELADAIVEVIGYACLVAIMSQGPGFHRQAEERLTAVAAQHGSSAPIVSSAGALVRGVHALGAKRVAVIAPYLKPLTGKVLAYLENEGIQVVDSVSLEIPKNTDVGRHDPLRLPGIAKRLDTSGADALIVSACVQMPSLAAVEAAEQAVGLPTLSAATATAWELLRAVGVDAAVPGAGALLSGRYSTPAEAAVA
jgi:maleate isomerase